MTESKQPFDSELERRLEQYVDIVRPGCDDSAIPPLTFGQYLPAVVLSAILTVAAVMVGILYF